MKYTDANEPLVCMLTQSTCYKRTKNKNMKPRGVLWHSTGANNPFIKRYVQPSDDDPNYQELKNMIGWNANGNDWNHSERIAGVHAFIGKLANYQVATVQTLPWNYGPWGCGGHPETGWSCNDGWLQFEICEDDLCDPDYFDKVYKEACELTAYLCKRFDIDPFGTVRFHGIDIPALVCHNDAYKLKHAGAHSDINHWFPKYGKNMATVRDDVAALMNAQAQEDDFMNDQDKFNKMWKVAMEEYRKELQAQPVSAWAKTDVEWAASTNPPLFQGGGTMTEDGTPNYMPRDFTTREQLASLFHRLCQVLGAG